MTNKKVHPKNKKVGPECISKVPCGCFLFKDQPNVRPLWTSSALNVTSLCTTIDLRGERVMPHKIWKCFLNSSTLPLEPKSINLLKVEMLNILWHRRHRMQVLLSVVYL